MKKIFSLSLLILFCAVVGKGWHLAKDGFNIRRAQVWEEGIASLLNEEASRALNQTFHYLGRGHQCYAFASEDGSYVVKIPRTDRYHLPFWLRALPFQSLQEKKLDDVARREAFLLESFRISFEELPDQTALLAMHLAKTKDEGRFLTLVDRLGRVYSLPMHETAFILQRKKGILMDLFQQALKEGKKGEAEQMLFAFLDVIVERAKKGILNKDPSFMRNFGFDGKKAFQIDIGSFYRREGIVGVEAYQKSIRETLGPVREWLMDVDQGLLTKIDARLDIIYKEQV